MVICDITNPTKVRRVFYDGSTAQRKIVVEAGETLKGIPLNEHVIFLFRNSDLLIAQVKQQNPPVERGIVPAGKQKENASKPNVSVALPKEGIKSNA